MEQGVSAGLDQLKDIDLAPEARSQPNDTSKNGEDSSPKE